MELLSEEESAQIAGVTAATLQQYRDFGLLEGVVKDDKVFYKTAEIRTLFYTKDRSEETEQKKDNQLSEAVAVADPTQKDLTVTSPLVTSPLVDSETAQIDNISNAALKVNLNETAVHHSPSFSSTEFVVTPTLAEILEDDLSKLASIEHNKTTAETQTDAMPPPSHETTGKTGQGTGEHSSVNVIEVLESNKSLKEQIEILREERNWLRTRVEKLEARSEREQMLILAESENVRNLISQKRSRGFWSIALPWLGEKSSDKKA